MTRPQPEVRFARVKIATGPTLRCAEAGSPSGVPILFLHGYSDHWRSIEPILPHLPPSFRVIAPDQRGHGRSERPRTGYDPATLAADAAALLDELGVARAIVVGHSLGCLVAQRLAVAHPARVARLMLVSGAASLVGNPTLAAFTAGVRALPDPVPRAFVERFQADSMLRPAPAAFVAAIVEEGCRMPARVWRAVADALEAFDGRADLPRVAAPTRIVWGDRDAFFGRADQEALRAGVPGATLTVYTGTGHAPHWEEPERFARELVAFAAGGPGLPS
jgi:pimeloyl-ACP methyl ester carboxylesterase